MYTRALRGFEKAWGVEHTSALDTIYNLGSVYYKWGRMDRNKLVMAEKMYMRALRGYEKAWEVEHISTLNTIYNLGLLYDTQSRLTEAEEMFTRALRGYEKTLGKNHPDTQSASRGLEEVQEKLKACE